MLSEAPALVLNVSPGRCLLRKGILMRQRKIEFPNLTMFLGTTTLQRSKVSDYPVVKTQPDIEYDSENQCLDMIAIPRLGSCAPDCGGFCLTDSVFQPSFLFHSPGPLSPAIIREESKQPY